MEEEALCLHKKNQNVLKAIYGSAKKCRGLENCSALTFSQTSHQSGKISRNRQKCQRRERCFSWNFTATISDKMRCSNQHKHRCSPRKNNLHNGDDINAGLRNASREFRLFLENRAVVVVVVKVQGRTPNRFYTHTHNKIDGCILLALSRHATHAFII